MILVIDNYDSFTWNLVQMVSSLSDDELIVLRNDDPQVDDIRDGEVDAVIISPGPGRPENAGKSVEVVKRLENTPTLGVCLGHQAIAVAFGGTVDLAPVPSHGKPSAISHRNRGIFKGCPSPMKSIRYHSLVVERETLPEEIEVTAETEHGIVMGLAHRTRPLFGVQFHPESYGSKAGDRLMKNFLEVNGR